MIRMRRWESYICMICGGRKAFNGRWLLVVGLWQRRKFVFSYRFSVIRKQFPTLCALGLSGYSHPLTTSVSLVFHSTAHAFDHFADLLNCSLRRCDVPSYKMTLWVR